MSLVEMNQNVDYVWLQVFNQSAEGTEGAVRMFNAILTKWGVKFKGNIDVYWQHNMQAKQLKYSKLTI